MSIFEKIFVYIVLIWGAFLLVTLDEYSISHLGRMVRDIAVFAVGYYILLKIGRAISDYFYRKKWAKFHEENSKELEEEQQRWKDLEACDFDQEKYDQLIRDRNAKK